MFKSIWEDLKREFSYGNMVNRLIIINAAIFVLASLLHIIFHQSDIYRNIIIGLSMQSDWWELLTHPWGIVTSMFLHEGFLHILFNMLFLYWFGRIVGDLLGDHRILPIYLLSGLAANLTYFIAANLVSVIGPYGYGASGAVMGIVLAAAALNPEMQMRLLLLGNVRLKYIAAALVVYDIGRILLTSDNTGGHIGHLGGAAFGYFFIRRLQEGDDLSAPVNNFLQKLREFFGGLFRSKDGSSRRGPRVAYRNPKSQKGRERRSSSSRRSSGKGNAAPSDLSHEERVDAILEKIKETGYENLTEEEKRFLFNASKK